jgi:hypothetical protein
MHCHSSRRCKLTTCLPCGWRYSGQAAHRFHVTNCQRVYAIQIEAAAALDEFRRVAVGGAEPRASETA